MEHDFISFKLWRQMKNTAIYISESGGCVTKNLRTGICYPRIRIEKNPRGHSHYPKYRIPHVNKQNTGLTLHPHRAVALTYLPNHDIFKTQVDHLDGNIFNNNLWNLEWVTPEENIRRAKEARRNRKDKIMEAWLAQETGGAVFAYINEPKFENGIWYGDYLLYVTNSKIPNNVKALLKQRKAVRVRIQLTVTKIVQLFY